ncbi:MAG: hypothetical protein JOZ87_17535 [Chloroflexi bacterium]|nr:hypothetical protein [Chloroflexota bacterium]
MSQRQHERASRFRLDVEDGVRAAAMAFRDNDVEASIETVTRLWWTSRLRGRRFAQLLQQARQVTQERISLGAIEQGQPGQREAMPYFLAVLRQLAERERFQRGHGAKPPSPAAPYPSAFGTRS